MSSANGGAASWTVKCKGCSKVVEVGSDGAANGATEAQMDAQAQPERTDLRCPDCGLVFTYFPNDFKPAAGQGPSQAAA